MKLTKLIILMVTSQTPTTKAHQSVRGFTLIELLIGISIFLFIILTLNTVIGGLFTSSFRALAMKRLADSTRTSLEIMGREMRLAKTKTDPCGGMGNAVFAVEQGGGRIKFKDFQNRCVVYEYDAGAKVVWKNVSDLTGSCNISSCEVFMGGSQTAVDNAAFTVSTTPLRPRVTISMVVSTPDPSTPSKRLQASLQTTLSPREP